MDLNYEDFKANLNFQILKNSFKLYMNLIKLYRDHFKKIMMIGAFNFHLYSFVIRK